jgi:hypothetical protein
MKMSIRAKLVIGLVPLTFLSSTKILNGTLLIAQRDLPGVDLILQADRDAYLRAWESYRGGDYDKAFDPMREHTESNLNSVGSSNFHVIVS